jgi:uncharacterized repeat protein (TIGR02543 family)
LLAGCESEIPETAKYTITYHGNGNTYGYPPIDNNQYISGSYATVLDKNTLQKEGYDFGGWNTQPDYSGTPYSVGTSIEIKNINVFLHAVWNEVNKYSVSFNSDGSTVQQINDIIHGSKISKPENPEKAGYTFIGWYNDLNDQWDFENDTVTENFILYAKWEKEPIVYYQYEVSDIYHIRAGYTVFISWVNPTDTNFSHVRIIPAGYEWAEDFGGNTALDKEPGISSYSMLDYANTEYITIKCIDKNGLVSMGIKYLLR